MIVDVMDKLDTFFTRAATLGCFGHCPIMPGTVGSLLGTIFSYIVFFLFRRSVVYGLEALLIPFSIVSCAVAEKVLRERDPSSVILDEFVVMPVCFLLISGSKQPIWVFVAGFIIFRFFDILKPLGLKRLESLPGGVGIVADDLGAALYTAVVLYIMLFIFGMIC